jgi:transmembrane sensor
MEPRMNANERRKRAAVEAAEWLARLQDEVTCLTREQYVDWLRESPLHVAEMLRVGQIHGVLTALRGSISLAGDGSSGDPVVVRFPVRDNPIEEEMESPGPEPATSTSRWHRPMAAIAAAFFVAVIATLAVMGLGAQTIQTERGERREVPLADGSVVQIDPQTRLRIKFDAAARRVVLERGRAVFHVTKNPSRPFTVQADETVVRAVGTAFGVERRNDEIVVTVAEGKVGVLEAVARRSAKSSDSAAQPQRARELFLGAGEQVKLQHSGAAEAVRKVDPGRQLAWAQGRLIFDNEAVAEVIEQFNRYSRVQIHVHDEELARLRVSGVFDAYEPEDFVAFMQATTGVRVVRDQGNDITLAPAAD